MTLRFTKVMRGWYATPDGRYAVVADPRAHISKENQDYTGEANDGWAAAFDPRGGLREDEQSGDTLEWLDTKREAVDHCNSHARRNNLSG